MLIKVKVFPCSKKEGVAKKAQDQYEVKVKEKPKQNMANKQTQKLLADYFGLAENKVRLVRGARRQRKIFEIAD